jgi:maleylpyruvate isomerase
MEQAPKEVLERLRDAQGRLERRLVGLTDPVVRRPSRLPGWSVGHVLAHLARNADSVVRRLEGAARDEIVDQYPGGRAGREAEIEAGAGLGAAELAADVRTSGLAVEQVASSLPDAAWHRLSRSVGGKLVPAAAVLRSRLREVEIHHADLGLDYGPADWPAEFVQDLLATEMPKLLRRADPSELAAWLTGRGPAPDLPSWS